MFLVNIWRKKAFESALRRKDITQAGRLIQKKKNVKGWKDEALCIVARYGEKDLAKKLISHGADITHSDCKPVRIAAKYGQTDIVKLFIREGKDCRNMCHTALMVAIDNNRSHTVKGIGDVYKLNETAPATVQKTQKPQKPNQ